MAPTTDEEKVSLIECLRPRLEELIVASQVLDLIQFIDEEQKERIRQRERTEGNRSATALLVTAVLKKPHSPGWFRAFLDALIGARCLYAADLVEQKLPDPQVEAENDECVHLIRLLSPSLVDMKVDHVVVECFSKKLLTQADREIVDARTETQGRGAGASELLKRIVRGRPGWFSTFLDILKNTGHKKLVDELSGGSPDGGKLGLEDKVPSLKNELTESEEPMETSPAGDDGTDDVQSINMVVKESGEETQDLYEAPSTESTEPPLSLERQQPDGAASGGAAEGGAERDDIVLRDYQADVARPALEGKNIIICLPTGSGKTRVAVYITKKHLDDRRAKGQPGKVVVLVNKIPLVEQHFNAEFRPHLKHAYKVERVSGESQLKISFTEIVKKNDIIICTAQILENFLERSKTGEDEGVNLSDLSLIVIDECHHTNKGDVYNHIMMRYLKQKHKNARLKKLQKQPVPLPQILGLTASPGVGGATKLDETEKHILRICANLDASKIMTADLGKVKKDPRKIVLTVEDRKEDPFGDVIKKIMNAIHEHAKFSPTCDLGSQNYEQLVVQMERTAAANANQKVRVCMEHLRQYNEGLNLSNTIRMRDSFGFLSKFYDEELKKKTSPDDEEPIQITDTERFLFNLFKDNKEELQRLANMPQYENDSLSKLQAKILQEFTTREKARGIISTKTRRSAIALSQWVQENPKFADVEVRASYIIGGGDQSVVKPMTAAELEDALNKFRSGEVNLLFATSVAEEGLDIPECNFVITYGRVTNEIAMIQIQGRGRAEDSSYTVVDVKNSGVAEKECVNEYRIKMMNKAIDKIRALNPVDYEKRITEFQYQAILEEKVVMKKKKQKQMKNEQPCNVKFNCRGCNKYICSGEDIETIENMHKVNVSPQFRELFIQTENTTLQERRRLDYETNSFIVCKQCGQRWGSMMVYRGIDCPCLHVKNFVVTIGEKTITKCTKWTDLSVNFPAFDYSIHASQVVESSDEEDA